MDITVVAPTYQRAERLRRLVAALEAQTLPRDRFEVVVVDNCSTDATPAVLAELVATSPLALRSLRTEVNRGPARARNLGWRSATTPYVACTDDDCVPDPGWLEGLLAAFDANPRVGVVQGRTVAPDGPRDAWTIAREIDGPTAWFEGCNLGFRRDALEATGGFDEEIGWYGEDTVAGWRVVDGGWERGFAADAVVVHDLEQRSVRWRVEHAWLEGNLVALTRRHPGIREGFWRPWALRWESVTFPTLVAGVVAAAAVRHPIPLLLAAPYLRDHRPLLRSPRDLAGVAAMDAAAVAGHLRGSVAARRLVL